MTNTRDNQAPTTLRNKHEVTMNESSADTSLTTQLRSFSGDVPLTADLADVFELHVEDGAVHVTKSLDAVRRIREGVDQIERELIWLGLATEETSELFLERLALTSDDARARHQGKGAHAWLDQAQQTEQEALYDRYTCDWIDALEHVEGDEGIRAMVRTNEKFNEDFIAMVNRHNEERQARPRRVC